ncbi:MAG: type II glyceraldehyde-3-phosphate dehydrogenase, partial [Nitrososphaeraceae archaeon]
MIRVFINGYGTIGRRLASAFSHDKEIQFVGIGKYSIDDKVDEAIANKFAVYVPEEKIVDFNQKGYDISGTIYDAVKD